MKKIVILSCVGLGLIFSGCASYRAASLTALSPEYVQESKEMPGLSVGCKAFSVKDCQTYLDRNVIKKGYQPIELTFYNQTDKAYLFSADQLTLACVSPERVAETVHTSTIGRVAGYTAGSLIIHPLIIAAVVDGICSHKANKKLDADFSVKSQRQFSIAPHSYKETLLFVPTENFRSTFKVTLVDQETKELKTLDLIASQ